MPPMPANLQDLPWDDVRVFLALARERTFSRAAARLGVNPSTIARRLSALEQALGVRLFDRTPDGALSTAEGELLLPYAERMEQAALELTNAGDAFETRAEGVVRVSAPPGVAQHFMAALLPGLIARHPGLRLEVTASVGYADLTRREADLALRTSRPAAGDLVAQRLAEETDALLASPARVEELGPLKALEDARFIDWDADLAHLPAARWIAGNVPADRVVLRTSSIRLQVAAAEHGLGVVLLPARYADVATLAPVRLSKRLATRLPPTPREALWLVGHRALRDVPRVAAVWKYIVEQFASATPRARR